MNAAPKDNGGASGATRKRRWVWPVLIVSFALNLLFVGLMAGSWWRHDGPRGGRHQVFVGAVERLMKDLPEAKRNRARQILDEHRGKLRPDRGAMKEARETAKEAVLTEPYNEQKVVNALSRFRELRNNQHEARHVMILALMKELNLEERQQLLDHIRAGFRARWRGRGGQPKGGKPKPQ